MNVNSVNPLCLLVNRVYGNVSEKNGYKFLSIDKGNSVLKKYDRVFSGLKYHIKKIRGEELVYDSDFDKIKFLTDDYLPFGKLIYFPALNVVLRCVFKQNIIFYPQVYLNECFYQIYIFLFIIKMETGKLYVEDRSNYFSGNLVDILKFKTSNLKLDKKTWEGLDFYFIRYVNDDKRDIDTVGQLHLSINKVFGYISEKYGTKYLTIHKEDAILQNYNQVFSTLKNKIESKEGKEITFNDEHDKIKFSSKFSRLAFRQVNIFFNNHCNC